MLRHSVWFVVLFLATRTFAQLSPGDLSKYHAKLEGLNNCTQCHELRKDVSDLLCLSCHKAIDRRIQAGEGYHSSAEVKGVHCAKCHSEHVGREFELVHWKDGKEKYDHAKSGWALTGAHATKKCADCHSKLSTFGVPEELATLDSTTNHDRTLLGLTRACNSCHADEHGEQMANDCESCHNTEKWRPAPTFSHAKSAFPLTGKHANVECAKCHKSESNPQAASSALLVDKEHPTEATRFRPLQFASCNACHKDAHDGRFGPNCSGCHTTENFAVAQMAKDFDHGKTAFPLAGKHAAVTCAKCHTSGKMTDPVAHAACMDCHQDTHRGQFADRVGGAACENCHTVEGFLPARYTLDAHQQSKYPLTGSHLAVPCFACHTLVKDKSGTAFAKFDFEDHRCKSCHADVHRGQLDKFINESGCEFCHNTETWHKVTFDHAKTRFPLIGKHESAECMGCHIIENPGTDVEMMRMSPLAQDCQLCHKDPHVGQFVAVGDSLTLCKKCHVPDGWKQLVFDHNRDAKWAPDGAHAKVACTLCHRQEIGPDSTAFVRYKPLKSACSDCHAGDSRMQK